MKTRLISSPRPFNIVLHLVTISDGILHVRAYDFHYSVPTIRVRSEVAAMTPTPSPTASVTAGTTRSPQAKKITITCVKGKLIKKVTAVKPVCPKGYKKK